MKTEILKGKESDLQYQNIEFLAVGGMGEIYIADDIINSCKVAMKIIRINDNLSKSLLEEEFKIALSLSHENIINTYFADEFSDSSGNYFYSVMEYMPEGNLQKKISSASEFISLEKCFSYFYDLMQGLKEAHKYIIHRDLKSQNVLIGVDGKLKLCDFGIAKYVDALTRTKTFKGSGSYPYMSPECWMQDSNTKQMDIYSLGILFYEILALKCPFAGSNEKEFRYQHMFNNLPSLPAIRKDVPIGVAEIIRKMTNKNFHERYQNMDEVIEAFNKIIQAEDNRADHIKSILENTHRKINIMAEENARAQKAQEEFNEKQDILNYSIEKLFDNFNKIADTVNASLLSDKITYRKFIVPGNAAASTYKLHFFDYSLTISFYSNDIIESYIKNRREEIINHQKKHYGFVMQMPLPEFIQTDNITFLGKVEVNKQINGKNIGFNFLLKKQSEDDVYGNWWVAKFRDAQIYSNVPTAGFYYPIDPLEFFKEYQFGRERVSHVRNMIFKEFEETDIVELIDKMPL